MRRAVEEALTALVPSTTTTRGVFAWLFVRVTALVGGATTATNKGLESCTAARGRSADAVS